MAKEVPMNYALTFAETGHLCVSTLHANNADQALERIMSFFPAESIRQLRMELSMNLKAIVAQQLIPKVDETGRIPAVEILLNTPIIADHIRSGDTHAIKEIMAKSKELGMQTFDQSLYDLYTIGQISYDSALQYADSENELRLMIKLHSAPTGSVGRSDFNMKDN
jgi:twitching motility protein PilU